MKITFKKLEILAELVNDLPQLEKELLKLANSDKSKRNKQGTYQNNALKIYNSIATGFDYLPFQVFALKGNSKLKFIAFSSLPLIDCPGAGSCKGYCYSLKAWRNPNAFFRQLQNSLLIRYAKSIIMSKLERLPQNKTVRLYVDGDFNKYSTLLFWFQCMELRKDLNFYGYSKSLHFFAKYKAEKRKFPSNYILNVSNGGKFDRVKSIQSTVNKLPITRGNFIATTADKITKKQFVCPGKCFDCLPNGVHACGTKKIKKEIVIPIH